MTNRKRNRSLASVLTANIHSMAAFGESKKVYKKETMRLRSERRKELEAAGVTPDKIKNELLHIDAAKDKIFSYSTMQSYERFAKDFAKFIAVKTGDSRTPQKEAVNYIQEYIEHCVSKGDSPSTVNLKLSAVCKATGQFICDYKHPIRHYAQYKRSGGKAKNTAINKRRAAASLELNNAIGLRRSELARLKVKDIYFHNGMALIYSGGKGGKKNRTVIRDKDSVEIIKRYYDHAVASGREYILTKEEMHHDADLHHERAMCAQRAYDLVISDLKRCPEFRDVYKRIIKREFDEQKKKLTEDLDKPYVLKGLGRQMQLRKGKPVEFDRVAVLYVSVLILHHFRSNTTVQHYLIK